MQKGISLLPHKTLYIQDEAFENCFKAHEEEVLRAQAIKIMPDDWRRCFPPHSLFAIFLQSSFSYIKTIHIE